MYLSVILLCAMFINNKFEESIRRDTQLVLTNKAVLSNDLRANAHEGDILSFDGPLDYSQAFQMDTRFYHDNVPWLRTTRLH